MKSVKSDKWYYLRGQNGPGNKSILIDTPVEDKPRLFLVPETEQEKMFMGLDIALGITLLPYGPTSLDPAGEWGYRFYENKTEDEIKKFQEFIIKYMEKAQENYDKGIKQEKESMSLFAASKKTDKKTMLN